MYKTIRTKTKIVYYQGQILKKLSTIAYLNPREDSISVVAFSKKEPDDKKNITDEKNEGKPKITKDQIKIMVIKAFLSLNFSSILLKTVMPSKEN